MENSYVILISGTSKGIGKHLAEYYLKKNYTVIGCSRSKSAIDSPGYSHYEIDITDEKNIKTMMLDIRTRFKKLDVVINNAAVKQTGLVVFSSLKDAKESFETNMLGSFLICRESVKIMTRNRYGRIINITSIAVPLPTRGSGIYGATKAALEQFTRVLAREVASDKITVNNIGFSFVKEGNMIDSVKEDERNAILQQTILNKEAGIDDITHTIDFFISPESRLISGQTIYIGGV